MATQMMHEFHPVDVHVGRRVRDRRKALGITQERLGEQLGLTFQQVQKYERGVNRVSASKLFEIARVLQVPVNWFFEGDGAPPAEPDIRDSREARELVEAYAKLPSAKVRRQVLDLVKTMVASQ